MLRLLQGYVFLAQLCRRTWRPPQVAAVHQGTSLYRTDMLMAASGTRLHSTWGLRQLLYNSTTASSSAPFGQSCKHLQKCRLGSCHVLHSMLRRTLTGYFTLFQPRIKVETAGNGYSKVAILALGLGLVKEKCELT